MTKAFDRVRQIFEGRIWIMKGRGSYPYNDDRYKEEVRYMYNEFDDLVKNTWANIKSRSSEYRQAIIEEYLREKEGNKERDKIERRNKLLEENMKLGMRLNMPGISEQEQESTWLDYKRRNNL